MTINSETRVAGPFEGNDSTVTFPFSFKVFDSDELLVVRATGATETVLVLGTNYSVTLNPDQNASPGGSVTLTAPLASGSLLTLTSDLEYLQPLDLTNQGGFYPRVINNAFDRVTILLQQLKAIANRTLKFPLSDGPVGDLPGRADRAGSVLAFDAATGEPIAGPNIAQLGTVAGGIQAIATVANNIDDVNTVADNIGNVNAVGGSISNVNILVNDLANVDIVAENIGDVNIVAANLDDLTNFSGVYYGARATDPTTRSDGSPMEVGDLYFNTAFHELRVYSGVQWRSGVSGLVTVQNFSGNSSTTAFTLNTAPGNENLTQVYIHGVYQQKNTYAVVGTTLTFATAPPTGSDNIEVVLTPLAPTDDVLRTDLSLPTGSGIIGFTRSPLAAAVGSLARAASGLSISIWEYANLVTVKPDANDPSTWTWTPALVGMINDWADGTRHVNFIIPTGNYPCGKAEITERHNWTLLGPGTLVKNTKDAQLSLYRCNKVRVRDMTFNGNIAWDEATNGSILPGVGRSAYAAGIYAQQCDDLHIFMVDFFGFANDPVSIRGQYVVGSGLPGSAGATLQTPSTNVSVTFCNIWNYRNTAVYLAGVHGSYVGQNNIWTDDDFGYVRGNGIYYVDWCEHGVAFANNMRRIGDNGVGVGEVGNPIAQNKHIQLLNTKVDRCVYMGILVAGGEDILVRDSTLLRCMMQQALTPEAFLLPGNPGGLQIKGGNTSRNKRIKALDNTIMFSYQRGLYAFDDAAVLLEHQSYGIELVGNKSLFSQQENIYVNLAQPAIIDRNEAYHGETVGITVSGGHELTRNRAAYNKTHGILSSQLGTFSGQSQVVEASSNWAWENGLNGMQFAGTSQTRATALSNKCYGNGKLATTVAGRAGLRFNGLTSPIGGYNRLWDNQGAGMIFDRCTNFVGDTNTATNNGLDATLVQKERAGIYVLCEVSAFRTGRLMSNKLYAGANQQTGYAAEFDTTGQLVAIGNEPDSHPIVPQNIVRKSWADIFNNE
ncbi:hypothetical protein UFOVP555_8 [uncultured Caudovirales phage]|uniref:Right handed beta helix region n=1 Tax=uncultured Caudovirales phage TaxID=2100421 RepID=A0A6J5MQV9_9CAUD|nr:hypothetical protein UFOVP555_8 [uncultured Caudovirales phage]